MNRSVWGGHRVACVFRCVPTCGRVSVLACFGYYYRQTAAYTFDSGLPPWLWPIRHRIDMALAKSNPVPTAHCPASRLPLRYPPIVRRGIAGKAREKG